MRMNYDELNDEQRLELKQNILAERGEGISYGELAAADDLVSDRDARDWAEGMEFSEDDFTCSCHGRTVKVEKIPDGLADEEKQMVDKWIEKLADEGLELLCPVDGSENEFCSAPAFGPACRTVDFVARGMPQAKEGK